MAVLPGMEELAGLVHLIKYYEDGEFDAIIVDCAPTGETLRLLLQHPRSAAALQGLLTEYFQVAVKIVQLIGEWLPLCEEDRTRLGAAHDNNALGISTVLGNRVWNQQAKFGIEIGPLTLDAFYRFLPSGSAHRSLMLLVRFFAGQELNFDVKLVLTAAEVPSMRLGEVGERAPRLGWSTWLKTREFTHDAEDTILRGAVTLIGALPA
jgi:type VI secretion system protein ImpH